MNGLIARTHVQPITAPERRCTSIFDASIGLSSSAVAATPTRTPSAMVMAFGNLSAQEQVRRSLRERCTA